MGNNNQTFNKKTTAIEAANNIDLSGRTCIVTGSSSGIGIETARVLALQGCTVYMACRTQSKAEKVRNEIAEDILKINKDFDADAKLKLLSLDLASLESVHACAKDFLSLNEPLHFLINNAGILAAEKYEESADGYELTFAVNHLGHFYLTSLLTPVLLRSQPSRVINVSSVASMFYSGSYQETGANGIQNKCGPFKDKYAPWSSYGFSKGCNVLHAREMNSRYFAHGMTSVSVHPGMINTSIGVNSEGYIKLIMAFAGMFGKTIPQGAATTVRCVSMLDSEIQGGHFYDDCQENNNELQANLQMQKSAKNVEKEVDEELKTDDSNINVNDGSNDSAGCILWEWSELLIAQNGYPLVIDNKIDNNIVIEEDEEEQ